MPFIKKPGAKNDLPGVDSRKIFIGRADELEFFVQSILKPETPLYNIISIWGDGGVGKSTLLARYIEEAQGGDGKDFCLTAFVDEWQTTAANIMEQFAEQLRTANHPLITFEGALAAYKEKLRRLRDDHEAGREGGFRPTVGIFAGAAVKSIVPVPVVDGILGDLTKEATDRLIKDRRHRQLRKDAERLIDPIGELTRIFVEEINQLANTTITLTGGPGKPRKRPRRIILFFDTFEQLAVEAAPWLLEYFLKTNLSSNIVLVFAGRYSIERSMPEDPKAWLPYREDITMIRLDSFSEDETRIYLAERSITDPVQVGRIWQLSRGLPLYLSLLTFNPQSETEATADVVANFLRWIPSQEEGKRQLALHAALFSKPFNQDDLAAFSYITEGERPALYRWLIGLPFVHINAQDARYVYHDLVIELFSRHLFQRSPNEYNTSRRALATYYRQALSEIEQTGERKTYTSEEWLEMAIALITQLVLLPDERSHREAILLSLRTYFYTEQPEEINRALRELGQAHPLHQISDAARQEITQLLNYFEAPRSGDEFIQGASYLIEKVANEAAFPPELLWGIYNNRGTAYFLRDDYPRALLDFDRGINLNPAQLKAYIRRGTIYYTLKEYNLALADFEVVKAVDPQNREIQPMYDEIAIH